MPDDLKPPTPTIGDKFHARVKGLIGEVPFGGSTAAELIAMIFAPPLEKRQHDWSEQVVAALFELKQRDVDVEKLRHDPVFVDTVLQATSMAIRTHQQEKLDALRNAIVNSGLPRAIDADLRQMFLGMVERFTPWHLRLLNLFDDPLKWFQDVGREFPRNLSQTYLDKLAFAAFDQLKSQPDFTDQICRDLQQHGLVIRTEMGIVNFMDNASASRTVEFGKQFLKFIREPPPQ